MKLRTIWTIPAMTFDERLRRSRDAIAMSIAYCLPVRIQYWTTMYMIGQATKMSVDVPATTCDEILRNLPKPKGVS
jgi:hypothetical protein